MDNELQRAGDSAASFAAQARCGETCALSPPPSHRACAARHRLRGIPWVRPLFRECRWRLQRVGLREPLPTPMPQRCRQFRRPQTEELFARAIVHRYVFIASTAFAACPSTKLRRCVAEFAVRELSDFSAHLYSDDARGSSLVCLAPARFCLPGMCHAAARKWISAWSIDAARAAAPIACHEVTTLPSRRCRPRRRCAQRDISGANYALTPRSSATGSQEAATKQAVRPPALRAPSGRGHGVARPRETAIDCGRKRARARRRLCGRSATPKRIISAKSGHEIPESKLPRRQEQLAESATKLELGWQKSDGMKARGKRK